MAMDPSSRPAGKLDGAQAERVLTFGYNAIRERYLNDVRVPDLALEGMRGLAALDSQITVERRGGQILVRSGSGAPVALEVPEDDDPRRWASLTVAAATAGAAASPALAGIDHEALLQAVFEASLSKLDKFSRYASQAKARENRAMRNGFGGIGIRFDLDGGEAVITEVMPDAPAGRAGITKGERLTHVDGQPVAGLEREEISRRLRGPVASEVVLSVKDEGGRQRDTILRRALVVPPTVTLAMVDGIAHLKVSGFNQRTASSLTDRLREARIQAGSGLKGVLLDLRGNPGGLLDQAVAMADLFMADGRIVSTRGRHPQSSQSYDAAPGDLAEDLPLVVLVDGKSASASEIVAAALQDSGRAVVIGTNSYGKGTVQTVVRLPNDGEMTLTWSRFHSPSGYALHELGVLPTICTADTSANPQGVITQVQAGDVAVTANLAIWRTTTVDEVDLRQQLRTTCPSAKHADVALDTDLGRLLLSDHALYVRALSINGPNAAGTRSAEPAGSASFLPVAYRP